MMSKKEKDVELIPSNVPSGWKVKHGTKVGDSPSGPNKYPDVEFDPGSGPHLVVFTLPPDSVSTAKFNLTDPMWVQQGTTSPTQSGMDPQIADWAILDGGKTLVLLDLNSQKVDLAYRVKAENYDKILDPIIKNGGGGTVAAATTQPQAQEQECYSIAEVGIALLIAFLAGFFVHRIFFGRPTMTG